MAVNKPYVKSRSPHGARRTAPRRTAPHRTAPRRTAPRIAAPRRDADENGYVWLRTVTYGYGLRPTNRLISATYVGMNAANAKSVSVCKHPALKIFDPSLLVVWFKFLMSGRSRVRAQALRRLGLAPYGTTFARKWNRFARKWNRFARRWTRFARKWNQICTQMEPDLHASGRKP